MKNEDMTLEQKITKKIQQAQDEWSEQYDRLAQHLKFASGDQWEENVLEARTEDERPSMVVNIIKPKINRIVNPYRINPLGMSVKLPDKEVATLLNDKLRSIESKSRASEAYEVAFECAVTGGIGWIHVMLDYLNDETTDVEPRIKGIVNPTSVFIDPYAEQMDGSDAKWGFIINYVDKEWAEEEYGDFDENTETQSAVKNFEMYANWDMPDNACPELMFYELKEDEFTRYFMADGTFVDEGSEEYTDEVKEFAVNEREIRKKTLHCYKYIGGKKVDEKEFDCNYIPLVPVFGDRILSAGQSRVKFAGQVHWNQDLQKMFNFYKSSELELVTNAPKNPWIAEEDSIENHDDDWAESNTRPKAVLKYKSVVKGGQQVSPPFRADNQAQTQSVIASANQAIADMDITSGVNQSMMGDQGVNQVQSGLALLTKENAGEVTTAQYVDNLSVSIEQTCRVVLNMLTYASDVERSESMINEDGLMYSIDTKWSEVITPQIMNELEVSVEGGSAYEGRRKEALGSLLALGEAHPQGISLVADLIASNLDHPVSDQASERFNKALPPEIRGNDENQPEDPRAVAMLQQAQQQMDEMQMQMAQVVEQANYYKGLAEQLNTQLVDNQKDRETDLAEKQIDSQTKIAVERMKQEGADRRELAKIQADANKQNKDIASEIMKESQITQRTDADDIVPQMQGRVEPMNPIEVDFNEEDTTEVDF
jgi:hypothetical protein